ncbi:methylamine utilization protein MauJ [Marinobacter salicampi]|uniref:methylamine utilization protein MauJ n=1 Tax=Marinobacter salicampi TaxID=435907 RepID=UPI001408A589|nr:methylamine utilization protein MauJ [Marinobacter salicampi]
MSDLLWVNANEQAQRRIAEPGHWVVATVEPRFGWPTTPQMVVHEGLEFVLMPQNDPDCRNAAIAFEANRHGLAPEAARKVIMHFCSVLSWAESAGLTILAWGAGDRPRPIGMPLSRVTTSFLDTLEIPHPTDDQERAALALYREGVSLDNPFYAFLSLYKVISVLLSNGRTRGAWIGEALTRLDSEHAIRRREELLAAGLDVGLYLRDEGRNAVAHAEAQPYANPDDIDDHFRLTLDLPLLRNLAELAVEERTTVQRPRTVRQKHFYELEGFKSILPPGLISELAQRQEIDIEAIELPDRLTLLARRGPAVWRLDDLVPIGVEVDGGSLCLLLQSHDAALTIRVGLDVAEERLRFDPLMDMALRPNRHQAAGLRTEIAFRKFQMGILLNGRLEVWEPEHFALLGQTAPYLPQNIRVDYHAYERAIEELEVLLADRDPNH